MENVNPTPDAATLRAASARGRESRLSPAPAYACLMLPYPPSINGLFAGKARRFTSRAYKSWQADADYALMQQTPLPRFTDRVAMTLTFGRPDKRRRDLGNLEKAVSDQLVKSGILADDSLIEILMLAWGDVTGCRVEIEPYTDLHARTQAARVIT